MAVMKHELTAKGEVVKDVEFDGRTHVKFGQYEVIAEGLVRVSDGAAIETLRGRSLLAVVATDDGTLRVKFEDASEMTVAPDLTYEAWQVVGPNGFLWVGGPGGVVTTWTPP